MADSTYCGKVQSRVIFIGVESLAVFRHTGNAAIWKE